MTKKTTLPLSFFLVIITNNYSPFSSQINWHNAIKILSATSERNQYLNQLILYCGATSINIYSIPEMIDFLLQKIQPLSSVTTIKCECNYSKYFHFLTI
jgi:hypothetical protein